MRSRWKVNVSALGLKEDFPEGQLQLQLELELELLTWSRGDDAVEPCILAA